MFRSEENGNILMTSKVIFGHLAIVTNACLTKAPLWNIVMEHNPPPQLLTVTYFPSRISLVVSQSMALEPILKVVSLPRWIDPSGIDCYDTDLSISGESIRLGRMLFEGASEGGRLQRLLWRLRPQASRVCRSGRGIFVRLRPPLSALKGKLIVSKARGSGE